MGNIYSEVGRAFKAKARQDLATSKLAANRAIDLLDATINNLSRNDSPRVKELTQAKQQFLELLSKDNASDQELNSLDRYFYHFAVAARLHR